VREHGWSSHKIPATPATIVTPTQIAGRRQRPPSSPLTVRGAGGAGQTARPRAPDRRRNDRSAIGRIGTYDPRPDTPGLPERPLLHDVLSASDDTWLTSGQDDHSHSRASHADGPVRGCPQRERLAPSRGPTRYGPLLRLPGPGDTPPEAIRGQDARWNAPSRCRERSPSHRTLVGTRRRSNEAASSMHSLWTTVWTKLRHAER
jgi:hypothetical protein